MILFLRVCEVANKMSGYVTNKLGISPDIIDDGSIIRIFGREYVIIENYKSIIEYTKDTIRLQGKRDRISVKGKNLCIAFYTDTDMRIDGTITDIILSD